MMAACGRPLQTPDVDQTSIDRAAVMDDIAAAPDAEDFDLAETLLSQALAEGYDHPRAYFLAGRLAEAKNDMDAAISAYQQAIATAPNWFEPRAALANAYLHELRYASADDTFAQLDRLHPRHPVGPYGQGFVALNETMSPPHKPISMKHWSEMSIIRPRYAAWPWSPNAWR